MGFYDVNNYYGGDQEIYLFMIIDEYVDKFLTLIEDFYDMSKYSSKTNLLWDHHSDMDN